MPEEEKDQFGRNTATKELIKQKLALNAESAVNTPGPVLDSVMAAPAEFLDTFDYIEKHTGEQMYLTSPGDKINQNIIKAQYNEGKQNSIDQGGWSELGGFLAQSVAGEIVLGTFEGAGYLLDVAHWGDKLMGGEGDWGNWLSDYMQDGKEWLREVAPIHVDPDAAGRSTWENMLRTDGWWASNGVSIASSLSILIPVAGWARGVGLVGKGLNHASQGARLGKWGQTAAKATKTVDKVMDKFPMLSETTKLGIDGIHKATVSRLIESQMEATAVFKERYDAYLNEGLSEEEAKKSAGEAASFTYNWNWAALLTDMPQYLLMGRTGSKLKKALHSKKPGLLQNSKILNKTKGLRKIGFQMGTEGLEEAYQFIIGEEGKHIGDIHAGLIDKEDTNFGERLDRYSQDSELYTSALFGALGGGVFSALGPKATQLINKAYRKGEMNMTEKDLRINEAKDRYTKLGANMDNLNKAAELKDEEAIFTAKTNLAFELAKDATLVNNWDKARSSMMQLKNATPEEREEQGLGEEFNDFIANIDEWVKHMDVAADIVDRAKGKHTYGLAESIANRQFKKYMFEQQKPVIEGKIDEEMKNVIPTYHDLSKDGRIALEQMLEIRAKERTINNIDNIIEKSNMSAEAIADLKAEQARGKEALKQNKEALKEKLKQKDIFTEEDQLAMKAMEGGSADGVVALAAKLKLLKHQNKKNIEEITYWTSRAGLRRFKKDRADHYKAVKEKQRKEKESEKASSAAEEIINKESAEDITPASAKPKKFKDLSISAIAKDIAENKAEVEDFTETPEETAELKKLLSDHKIFNENNPSVREEEAEEDLLEVEEKDIPSFEDEGSIDALKSEEEFEDESFKSTEEPDSTIQRTPEADFAEELEDAVAHEELEVPINDSSERAWRKGDDVENPTLSSLPSQLAWLSSNNEIAEETTPEQVALSSYLEDPGNPISDLTIEFGLDVEYMKANKKDLYKKMLKSMTEGVLPSNEDVGYMPIMASIKKNGKPVEHQGIELTMNLHDPDFYFKPNGDPKNPGISEYQAKVTTIHKRGIVQQIMRNNIVSTALEFKSNGKLNVTRADDGSFAKNIIAKTLKRPISKVDFLVGNKTGNYVTADKRIRLAKLSSAEPGAIYTQVETANGNKFPLRLHVNELSKNEGTLIHAIYLDVLEKPELIGAPLSDGIKDYIKNAKDPRISELANYLNDFENLKYQELLEHLVYEGSRTAAKKEHALLHYVNTTRGGVALPNTVKFGKTKFTAEILKSEKGKQEFINWIAENKRRQIDITYLGNEDYKSYLNDNAILTTNVKTTPDGRLFVQPVISYSSSMQVKNKEENKTEEATSEQVEESSKNTTKKEQKQQNNVSNVGTPAFISKVMKQNLLDLNYSRNDIKSMKPSEAVDIVENQKVKEKVENTDEIESTDIVEESSILATIKMFQDNIKQENGDFITVNLPENDDIKENPC